MIINPWNLNSEAYYTLDGDVDVKLILIQLGIADLIKMLNETKEEHVFIAFGNHPTHWITVHQWKGLPEYSPNHGLRKISPNASANGLLLTASSKAKMSRGQFFAELKGESKNDSPPIVLHDLPSQSAN